MKKNVGFLLAILPLLVPAFSQDDYLQRPALGVYFFFNDFKTNGKLKDMSPGLALNYLNGLNRHFDFSSTLTGSFINYQKENGASLGQDNLLLEGDVSVKGKLFSNKYWVSPFLQVGTGISKFRSYWGAFIPAGTGFQVNLFNEGYFVFNAQYRIAVTETVKDHFFYGIGIAGVIGRRRGNNKSVLPE